MPKFKKQKLIIYNFEYGFEYKGFLFGWKNEKLFRITSTKGGHYPLKELSQIKVGNKKGYRIVRDKKTIEQLKELSDVFTIKKIK